MAKRKAKTQRNYTIRELRTNGRLHTLDGKDDGPSRRLYTVPPLINNTIRIKKKKARKLAEANRRFNRGA